jgi:diguanylate cyclase
MSTENERTFAFAEIALGQIRSLRQTAIPRNYEIWYTYAAGYNPGLNNAVNETLARNGKLVDADLEQLYETYLSQARISDRLDKVGARVLGEIDEVMGLIADALGNTATFGSQLLDSTKLLNDSRDKQSLVGIVEALVKSTKSMQENNQALETRLNTSRQEIFTLQQNLDEIRAESMTDPLCGLGNRKYFDRAIDKLIGDAKRSGEPLTLLLLDIDYFKSFNDNYGHLTGDQVLRLVAQTLRQNVKGRDVTARYGGEEFAVLLPATPMRQALTVADNIRRAVMSKELKKKSTGEILGRVTISIGVAAMSDMDDQMSLIERADICLYAAKRNGRNRVICETDPEYQPDQSARVA